MKNKRFAKLVLAATLLVAIVSSGVALAVNPFTDVEQGRFFTEPVDWAYNNGVTLGTSPTTFHPDRPVTRGENVTFAYRYDQNIVQPALDARYTKVETDTAIQAALPQIYHASVDADGSTNTGTTSGVEVGPDPHVVDSGSYVVSFPPEDITTCIFQATLVDSAIAAGQIVAAAGADPDSVAILTTDETGTAADQGFHLSVFC